MTGNGRRVNRLQVWLLILTVVVITGAVAAPIVGNALVERQTAETQLAVTCTSARANIVQLTALRLFSEQIGVPWRYPIPEVPPECDGH